MQGARIDRVGILKKHLLIQTSICRRHITLSLCRLFFGVPHAAANEYSQMLLRQAYLTHTGEGEHSAWVSIRNILFMHQCAAAEIILARKGWKISSYIMIDSAFLYMPSEAKTEGG